MRFNKKQTLRKSLSSRSDATVNHEGGLAFEASAEMELYLRACTGLFEDKAYEKAGTQLTELRNLIPQCSQKFVLQLANYVRNEMHLRTLPLVLLAEASRLPKDENPSLVREYTSKIVKRADEPAELVSYVINHMLGGSKNKFPEALKKGLSDVLNGFDEYQLAKWNNKNRAIKLRDVVRIVHPKPKNVMQSVLYKRILEDSLTTPETWEVVLSEKGASAESWNEIAPKMGFMALLRNLRNFEKHNATKAIEIALAKLRDPQAVRKSKQLPFRYFSAERVVSSSVLRDTCREAMQLSLSNLPKWTGSTAIFCDNSGSMYSSLSSKSTVEYIDIASLMGAMAGHLCQGEYLTGAFGAHYSDVAISRLDSVISNAEKIKHTNVGHATYAYLCLEGLIQRKKSFDRVLLFSDMQCYSPGYSRYSQSLAESWIRYKQQVNPNAVLYSFDLSGQGSLQFPESDKSVVQVSGWSEKVFKLIPALEEKKSAISEIKSNF